LTVDVFFFSKSRRRKSVAAFANILWVEQLRRAARTAPCPIQSATANPETDRWKVWLVGLIG
jgi:hypothetical protein